MKKIIDEARELLGQQFFFIKNKERLELLPAAIAYCEKDNRNYLKMVGHGQQSSTNFTGYKNFVNGEYVESTLYKAIKSNKPLIIINADFIPQSVAIKLTTIENGFMSFANGETVQIPKDWYLLALISNVQRLDKALASKGLIIEGDKNG